MTVPSSSQDILEYFNFIGEKCLTLANCLATIRNPFTGNTIAQNYQNEAKDLENALKATKVAQNNLREKGNFTIRFLK